MAEYIGREAAMDAIQKAFSDQECDCEVMPDVFGALQEIPAADVAPVRHGRWIVTDVITCSECQHFTRSEFAGRWNYCPNCGARMDKEDEHD